MFYQLLMSKIFYFYVIGFIFYVLPSWAFPPLYTRSFSLKLNSNNEIVGTDSFSINPIKFENLNSEEALKIIVRMLEHEFIFYNVGDRSSSYDEASAALSRLYPGQASVRDLLNSYFIKKANGDSSYIIKVRRTVDGNFTHVYLDFASFYPSSSETPNTDFIKIMNGYLNLLM